MRLGRVVRATREEVEFALEGSALEGIVPREASRLHSTLLISIVKFDRFEWALEKATELGVTMIVPLSAARSEKALVAAAPKRAARWEKILVESAQQARRLRAPALKPILPPLEAFLQSSNQAGAGCAVRILLSERRDTLPLRDVLNAFLGKFASALPRGATRIAVLAVGPEGGWTDREFGMATAAEFVEASLGPTILRTETAVAAALASLNYALGG